MNPRKILGAVLASGIAWSALLLVPGVARSQDCNSCSTYVRCQHFHCPPGLKHCTEGPPHIHFKHGCPRPICNPCVNSNWGYFETCWNPWPWPPDFSHCRFVPPAATVILNPHFGVSLGAPQTTPVEPRSDEVLPSPRPMR